LIAAAVNCFFEITKSKQIDRIRSSKFVTAARNQRMLPMEPAATLDCMAMRAWNQRRREVKFGDISTS
jgi:hypothetical protein